MPLPTRSGHPLPDDYAQVLEDLKHRIREAQIRAHRVVNTELVGLYWSIGKTILERQGAQGWGAKVIEQLSADLTREFPGSKGFSRSNLEYMRRLAAAWLDFPPQLVGEMPWGHIRVLLDKLDDQELRDWYAGEASRPPGTRDTGGTASCRPSASCLGLAGSMCARASRGVAHYDSSRGRAPRTDSRRAGRAFGC